MSQPKIILLINLHPLSSGADVLLNVFIQIFVHISGPDSGMPSFGRGDDNDDRISHILNEASNMMKPSLSGQQSQQAQQLSSQMHLQHHQQSSHSQHDDSRDNDDSDSLHNQCTSPFSKDSQNRRLRKYDNDDISHEKVARIYQEELAKLITRAPRDGFPK